MVERYYSIADEHARPVLRSERARYDIPPENDQIVLQIQKQVEDKLRERVEQRRNNHQAYIEVEWCESPYVLMAGTLRFIDYLLHQHEQGTPIDTIVFLDRSARLAAHLVRVSWKLMQEAQLIDGALSLPSCKFIDIGRSQDRKFDSPRAVSLASTIYDKSEEDLGTVLVADEIMVEGRSARTAIDIFRNVYGYPATAISIYSMPPGWYRQPSYKGVKEAGLLSEYYDIIDGLSETDYEVLRSLAALVPDQQSFTRLILTARHFSFVEYAELVRPSFDFTETYLSQIYDAVDHIDRFMMLGEVYTFFKSAGGFLGLRPPEKELLVNYEMRYLLTYLAQLTLPHITRK